MAKKIIVEVISVLLIILFVYAAVSKLLDFSRFRIQLSKSPLLAGLAPIVAVTIPLLEIIIAVLLAGNKTRQTGLLSSLFLLIAFTAYILCMLLFSYKIPCSCGGIISKMSWTGHVYFNLSFIIINIVAIRIGFKEPNYAAT